MFFYDLDKALYVHNLNTVTMRWNDKNDVSSLKNVMTARDTVELKSFILEHATDIIKSDVIRPLL